MKIPVGQRYKQDVSFGFTQVFLNFMYNLLNKNIIESESFKEKYPNYDEFAFTISAKKRILVNAIKGPLAYQDGKYRYMSHIIFLPFDIIMANKNYKSTALEYIFDGMYTVFEQCMLDYSKIKEQEKEIIEQIMNDKNMFHE